ncbi:ABC transporter ATP-binding protein [Balneatrix alpica]|uniref:ABC transporter ATP-binding protein n=1 Tax=Balneatrix alpica TaxID=75684 RepID=A0ABV5ZAY5_9GAMM|nr:ABC transporter ATP-binding protein [Balneatrix alpica]
MSNPPSRYDQHFIKDALRQHKPKLWRAHLIALFTTLCAIPIPLLLPLLVDEVLLQQPGAVVAWVNAWAPVSWQQPVGYVVLISVVTVILRLLAVVLGVWQGREFTQISKQITYRMREGVLRQLQRLSMREYETLGSGAVASRLVVDMDTVDTFLGSTVSRLLIASLSVLGASLILLVMHWQLALFILFLNPIVVYFTMVLGKRVKELKRNENRAYELFQGALTETLEAIQQIRASNRDEHYISRLLQMARQVRDDSSAYAWKSDAASKLSFVVFLIGFDLFRALAMFMVLFAGLSIGEMFAVFGYLWFMMGPVQEVLNIQYAYFGAKAALQRINSLMALEVEPDYPPQQDPFQGRRSVSVRVDNLHFSYAGGEPVLKGVSLALQAGEKVALVGASGGGKSTLVQMLLGLYPADEGRIEYQGVALQQIGLNRVREKVVTVLQQPALFNGTIRDNLCMGREYNEEALWQALTVAQLADYVKGLEQRLDTLVGRQGIRLSGGQRQRLAIARMVLADPSVVILDEATSALDAQTEYDLHQALNSFLAGRTTLIIAHRLSAVKQADRVYVFEDGHIIEQGGHEQLLQAKGLYARLYGELQSLEGK